VKSLAAQIRTIALAHGAHWPFKESDTIIRRVYAGRHQRSAGAWSFYLAAKSTAHYPELGSSFRAKDMAKLGVDGTTLYTNHFGQQEILPK
jgi:hypothetical protein